MRLKKLGINYDFRKDIYNQIESLNFEEIKQFYQTEIKPIQFNTAIIGKKENLNLEAVEQMGTFEEVGLKEIFGY
ncbi:hypothetical protein D3C87_1964670 [compost metagenome]